MMFKRKRICALCLAILTALSLSGCQENGAVVTPIEQIPIDQIPSEYAGAGYYAPQSTPAYGDTVIPAPQGAEDVPVIQAPPDGTGTAGGSLSAIDMQKGDFTYGVVVGLDTDIHPLRTTYKDIYAVNQIVFESLVELNQRLEPVPLLADRWEVDAGVWTFTLRSGIQFHNGVGLTANDVVASYQEVLRNPSTRWHALVDQAIEGMEAKDETTLRVKAKSGMGYMMLYAMTFPVMQSGTINSQYPAGTGPFWYIKYDWSTSLRLESNPLWWKRASDEVNSVVVLCYKSIKSAMTGLELGEVDALATEYPTAALSRGLTDRMTLDYSTQTYECIIPNLRSAILSDLSVRQAMMYAIDRTTLGNTAYAGMVQESETPVIPGSWIYDAQATRFNYSPERALQLLYDAGWSDPDQDGILQKVIGGVSRNLALTLITYDRGTTVTRSEAANLIAQQLRKVGFDVTIKVGTASKVQDQLAKGDFELALCAYELSEVPNLAFFLSGSGSSNYARYSSSVMDSYLRSAYNAQDAQSLASAMSKVQLQVAQDLPVLGLFFRAGVMVTKKSIGDITNIRQYDLLRGLAAASGAD